MIKSPCIDCGNKKIDKRRCYENCKKLHNEQMRDAFTLSLSVIGADSIHAEPQTGYSQREK